MISAKSLIFITAGSLVILACNNDKNASNPANQAIQTSSRAFIDSMVPHHEMAVVMADEAMEKAVHPGLKVMAAKMKEDQTNEIAKLKEVRKTLLGSDATPKAMHMAKMPAGDGFDKMFIQMMIDHHQGAIEQSNLALDKGVSNPLDSIAKNIIATQKMEQKMLQDSLKAWYNEEHKIGDGSHM